MPLDRKIQSGPPACSTEILFPDERGVVKARDFNNRWLLTRLELQAFALL
jgi:hypothetical protein